jgi:hypothetical protein
MRSSCLPLRDFSLRSGAEDMSDLTGGSEADLLALMARRPEQAAVDER